MFKRWGPLLLPVLLLTACGSPAPSTPGPAPLASPTFTAATPITYVSPGPTAAPVAPTVAPVKAGMPLPTPAGPPTDSYIVQAGDTLGAIAMYRCGCEIAELAALNHIQDPASLQVGQTVLIPVKTDRVGPPLRLLPDSEVVYSPAYLDFDVAGFVGQKHGYLASYTEVVSGRQLTGAQLVEKVAREYSVGPRLLLALLEYQGRWVTGQPDSQLTVNFPLSLGHGGHAGLWYQLSWAANVINQGYYAYKRAGTLAFTFVDGGRAVAAPGLNAGTVALENALAATTNWDTWQQAIGKDGFMRSYESFFGDTHARAVEPLVPADLTQPELTLPWQGGLTWYLSSGPHAAWFDGSAWAALDFAPSDVRGHCGVSTEWITAAAPGLVLRSGEGQVLVDLDGDGHEETGWVLFYLHVVPADQLHAGMKLARGDRIGHPSCEGGAADSSHVHFARRYNGEWIAADGPLPMVLSGWRVVGSQAAYDGKMVKGSEVRQACECWDNTVNGIASDNAVVH